MEDREGHTHFFKLNCCNLWDCVDYVLFYVRFNFQNDLKHQYGPPLFTDFTPIWWQTVTLIFRRARGDSPHVSSTGTWSFRLLSFKAELVWEWKRFWPCCARWVTQQAMISVCELSLKIHLKSSLIRRISLLWSFWSTPRISPRLQDCAVF